ncbi:hypothetical protein F5B18DRAFT_673809 [Nemania serpens]|nr:hypothetical protein F5B18DRAFT_673809 [Nemania serpens]
MMGPFALSIPGHRLGVRSQKPRRRRRDAGTSQRDAESRSPSPSTSTPYLDSDAETLFSSAASRLPSEAINPLSHSPDTLRQLAVAGLSPEDELPSQTHPGFPHRPLPDPLRPRRRRGGRTRSGGDDGSGAEMDPMATSSTSGQQQQYSARVRHLNTMTAVVHRCLRDGDMARAKRALGFLVRTRDVDLRSDHLWAIGLEILMRDGERGEERGGGGMSGARQLSSSSSSHGRPRARGSSASSDSDSDTGSDVDVDMVDMNGKEGVASRQGEENEGDDEDDDDEEDDDKEEEVASEGSAKGNPQPPERWGSVANLPQVKVYLETLIQQHPYDAHRAHLTSAVDFWPALFGVEIYGLDAEFRIAAHHIRAEHGFPSPSSSRDSSPGPRPGHHEGDEDGMDLDRDHDHNHDHEEEYDVDVDDGGDLSTSAGTWRRREKKRRRDATDALRAETRRGALEIAARMDAVLENAPYSTHGELLRLRAHVALYVGDLHLPSGLVERYAAGQRGEGAPGIGGTSLREAERGLRVHVRTPDERVALARRAEGQGQAMAFFKRAVAAGGRLEDWVVRLLDAEDEDEDEDEVEGGLPR